MRPLAVLALLAVAAPGAETQPHPLSDGQESIVQYARRSKLEPTKNLDLGNGVKLELVLIPAGKFIMGTPEPVPVDEAGFRQKIVVGQAVLAAGGSVLLVFLAVIAIRAVRQRRRPQYSLARFVAMIVAAGVGVLGGTHWQETARSLKEARAEYQKLMARSKNAYYWEKPAHEVALTRPYYMGKFEVTQEQYQGVVGANPAYFEGRDLPVEQVSWDDAVEFCKRARDKTGQSLRLPTEAEWEYVCRAGTMTRFCSGDEDTGLDSVAWFGANSGGATHAVGRKVPNAFGLYDMHGNVWEWCADRFAYYGAEAVTDPQELTQSQCLLLRGGSWGLFPWDCRSANRNGSDPGNRSIGIGFRVVVSVPSTP